MQEKLFLIEYEQENQLINELIPANNADEALIKLSQLKGVELNG